MKISDRIAIPMGGSGARCGEALIYLCAAGLGPEDLTMVTADADTQNYSVAQTTELMGLYSQLQGTEPGPAGSIFRTVFRQPEPFHWSPFRDGATPSLGMHFGYAPLGEKKGSAYLMAALYPKDQREASLDIGFRGKPSIGAAICSDTLTADAEPWRSVRQHLTEQTQSNRDCWVFGMGSVFGGMGAAGLPTIPRKLKAKANNRERIRLGDLLLLPYFSFPASPSGTGTVYARPELFALNSREAIRYYADQNREFNDFYVLGAAEMAKQPTFALGAKQQNNLPHFVELMGGLSSIRFFGTPADKKKSLHLLAVEDSHRFGWSDVPDVPTAKEPNVGKAMNRLARVCQFYLAAVFPVLKRLRGSRTAADARTPWYVDFLRPNGMEPSDPDTWKWFCALQRFCLRYLSWLRRTQENSGGISLSLVNTKPLQRIPADSADAASADIDYLNMEEFNGDLLNLGRPVEAGSMWREFCHAAARPDRSFASARVGFQDALFAAAKAAEA